MPGPLPKPTQLKVMEGNPGKRPLNDREPKPVSGAPSCPSWLPKSAKSEWHRVIKELDALGLVHKIDRAVLEGYAYWYSEWRDLAEDLAENGRTVEVESENGYVKVQHRPEAIQCREAFKQMKTCAAEFGMGPASRSRVSVPWTQEDEWDWLDKKK